MKAFVTVLVIILVSALLWGASSTESFRIDVLLDSLVGLNVGATYLVFAILYTIATLLFLPGSIFALAGGALFGPIVGSAINLGAATLGAALAFLISRYLAADWVADKISEQEQLGRLKHILEGVDNEGWRFVAFVRLVPIFPFNILNYVLGLTGIGFRPYVVTSFICMAPASIAYSYLGYVGRAALDSHEDLIQMGFMALGLVAFMLFLPRLVKMFSKKDIVPT